MKTLLKGLIKYSNEYLIFTLIFVGALWAPPANAACYVTGSIAKYPTIEQCILAAEQYSAHYPSSRYNYYCYDYGTFAVLSLNQRIACPKFPSY